MNSTTVIVRPARAGSFGPFDRENWARCVSFLLGCALLAMI